MKLMIASDIHGSAYFCRQLLSAMEIELPTKLILLGDILYHGPRNDLPTEYAPKQVAEMLNGIKEKLICVRGNCDTEVDQMMLYFPILSDSSIIFYNGHTIYATHGHHHSNTNLPPLEKGDMLLCGHTHIPAEIDVNGVTYLNPGSISNPKENSWHGYMIIENDEILWKDLSGEIMKKSNI